MIDSRVLRRFNPEKNGFFWLFSFIPPKKPFSKPISKKSQEGFLLDNAKVGTGFLVKLEKNCFFLFFTIFWNLKIFQFFFSTLTPHNFFISTRIEKKMEIKAVHYDVGNIMPSRNLENSSRLVVYADFTEKKKNLTKISVNFKLLVLFKNP